MKDAEAALPQPTHRSISAQLMNSATLAEASIRRNGNRCSPRANIAFAALDTLRIIVSWLSRLHPDSPGF